MWAQSHTDEPPAPRVAEGWRSELAGDPLSACGRLTPPGTNFRSPEGVAGRGPKGHFEFAEGLGEAG
jgi:hypothetical protein